MKHKHLPIVRWFFLRDESVGNPVSDAPPQHTRALRVHQCVRITDRQLMDFRALTINLSDRDICFETFAAVEKGQEFDLRLDTESSLISLHGVAKWCQEVTEGIFHCGVCLRGSQPGELHALARYLGK